MVKKFGLDQSKPKKTHVASHLKISNSRFQKIVLEKKLTKVCKEVRLVGLPCNINVVNLTS